MSNNEDLPFLLRLYVDIRQWFQPYYRYYPKPKPEKKPKKVAKKPTKKVDNKKLSSKSKKQPKSKGKASKGADAKLVSPVKILDYPKPLTKVMTFKKKPGENKIWCYHDASRHQVAAHFRPGMGYVNRDRDDAARKKLKPMIFPTNRGVFDRTHLIPIGYHGSEDDPRLLIGWDSDMNRNQFCEFEQKQKKRKESIYWLTFVTKTAWGARWHFMIYSVETEELLDELIHDYKADFVWKQ